MQSQARARSDRVALRSAKALEPVVVSQAGKRPEMTVSFSGGPEVPFSGVGSVMAAVALAEAGGIAGDRLRSIVDRIERLEEERKALVSDIKDIFSEAKSAGFDVKAFRQVIRMRKWEPAELAEHEALVDLYRRALGM